MAPDLTEMKPYEDIPSIMNAHFQKAMRFLDDNDSLKITITNIAFFKEWYESIEEALKPKVKYLATTQLSFMGGWVDLADQIGDYHLISDNLRKAQIWLKSEFDIDHTLGYD